MKALFKSSDQIIEIDSKKKVVPVLILIIACAILLAQFLVRLNIIAIVSILFCIITAVVIFITLVYKRKLYSLIMAAYLVVLVSMTLYFAIFGADAGFGAYVVPKIGFSSAAHKMWQGQGNFFTRLIGNILIFSPGYIFAIAIILSVLHLQNKKPLQKILAFGSSALLIVSSIIMVFTMNLRSIPNLPSLKKGEKDYLKKVDKNKTKTNAPNVLFVMMDDLGYADISLNKGALNTPNIDSIGKNGINFTNFHSGYSVCSPSRFAAFTGRQPYRGGADNVIFPTVNTVSPFASTRQFNSFEMKNNCDGLLGDEITVAETFKAAGYNTGIFGKWHLGDYGQYLPTNQGFDYFYGSHHVNDMAPFYHVKEKAGQYEIVVGAKELKNQDKASELIHNEIDAWVDNLTKPGTNNDKPFFACYTTPWPHAPIFVGDKFKGASGFGKYADCVLEFDYYLGLLINRLKENGVYDDTIIMLTSDNGPALEGSPGTLRGGKYTPYEAGTGVPCVMQWNNAPSWFNAHKGNEVTSLVSLLDLYPTLVELCEITGNNGEANYMPKDRAIDGISIVSLLKTGIPVHDSSKPILHMTRGNILAIQYEMKVEELKKACKYPDKFDSYPVSSSEYAQLKFFPIGKNDNPAFFNLKRKNYLFIISEDRSESYNATEVYPSIAEEMKTQIKNRTNYFKENQRGKV